MSAFGGGLFGSSNPQQQQQQQQQQQPGQSGGLFGGGSSTPGQTGGGLFGSLGQGQGQGQPGSGTGTGGGLFGGQSTTQAGGTGGGLFGGQQQQPQPGGGLFGGGQQQQQPSGGLFGGGQQQQPSGGLFGGTGTQQAQPSGGLVGGTTQQQQQQPSGGLFGGTQQQQPSGGLFGGTQQQQQQPSGGLFGGATTQQPTIGGGLFGSTAQQPATGGGLFGSTMGQPAQQQQQPGGGGLFGTAPSTGGGLFGSTTQPQQQQPSLFGQPQAQQPQQPPSLFGQPQVQQPQQPPSLFGQPPQPSGLLGGSLLGGAKSPLGVSGGLFSSRAVAVPAQQQQDAQTQFLQLTQRIQSIVEAWNPDSPNNRFQHYFYNLVDPAQVQLYGRPAKAQNETLWQKALRENPDPSCCVPVIANSFDDLKARVDAQAQQAQGHQEKLKDLKSRIEKLSERHELSNASRLHKASSVQTQLTQRLLKLVQHLHLLIPALRSSAIRPEEEAMRAALEEIDGEIRRPGGMGRIVGKLNELWALVGALNAMRGSNAKGGGDGLEWAVVDEDGLNQIVQILVEEQAGLVHLTNILQKDMKDVAVVYGEEEPEEPEPRTDLLTSFSQTLRGSTLR